jgi:hypothetical protein
MNFNVAFWDCFNLCGCACNSYVDSGVRFCILNRLFDLVFVLFALIGFIVMVRVLSQIIFETVVVK